MRVEVEKKLIEQEIKRYIAEDGKIFFTKYECEEYENKLKEKENRKKIESFEIKKMKGYMPISTDHICSDSNDYYWYKVNNETEWNILNETYGNTFSKPNTYPMIICVEESYWDGDCWDYYLDNMFEVTKSFWNLLGYKVNFEKIDMRYWEIEFECDDSWSISGAYSFFMKQENKPNEEDIKRALHICPNEDGLGNIIEIYDITDDLDNYEGLPEDW